MTTPPGDDSGAQSRHTNRLAHETSPYLLQHQHNPVDWYPWGEEAFDKARREDKPLLISIGYSACHWCHVMERESFEDEETARLINETVVPVKVDREERPDVDAIYMSACVAITGQGGWPLNAFVTPDLRPFFVGTYFPREDWRGRPGFRTLLARIGSAWRSERSELLQDAARMHEYLQRAPEATQRAALDAHVFEAALEEASQQFDLRFGGFGDAPKFPPDQRLALLLAIHHDAGDATALSMVTKTLDSMARGGIYDQLAGGFARYSVDAQWLIPHFEKMLYNQALLVPVYLDAFLVTGSDSFQRVARDTLDWVLRDMLAPEGLFYCAVDADSEGEEGKYYAWTPGELEAALGAEDSRLAWEYYGFTDAGNFEHETTVLHVPTPAADFAHRRDMDPVALEGKLDGLRTKLLDVRSLRIAPGTDDKCLVSWNSLMISALCRGWQVLGDGRYLEAARRAADFILRELRPSHGELLRVYCRATAKVPAVLDDYAFLVAALVDLYESCFDVAYLRVADELGLEMIERFADPEGGFLYTSGQDESLIARTRDVHDGALPSGSSVAVMDLLRLGVLFDRAEYAERANRAFESAGPMVLRVPGAFSSLLQAFQFAWSGGTQVIVAGDHLDPATQKLLEAAWRTYVPGRVLALATGVEDPVVVPARGKVPAEGRPSAYVCRNHVCEEPIASADELVQALKIRRS
jgi:uncharacterized protein